MSQLYLKLIINTSAERYRQTRHNTKAQVCCGKKWQEWK